MTIKLLQWNCMYNEDISAAANFVKQTDADIVCLQELTCHYSQAHTDTGAYIAEQLGFNSYYDYGLMRLPDGNQANMGMGIFSRFPLSNHSKIPLQPGSISNDVVIQDERFALSADVTIDTVKLQLLTAHLPFHPTFRSTPHKMRMIERLIAATAHAQETIFAGDLNTTPHTKAARMLRQNGFKNLGPALYHPTWTTKPFTIGDWHYEALQWRLDYVLGKGDIRAVSKSVLQTKLSDHLPILVEFQLI